MTYREIATSMIEEGESLVLVVYDDATGRPLKQGDTIKGHPTIGWGRNLAGKGISEAEARALLAADLNDSEEAARGFVGGAVWRALSDVRRAVLIDMAHNLGAAGLYRFAKLRGALERVNYEQAAREIEDSGYFRQVKSRGVRNRDAMRSGQWGDHGKIARPKPKPEVDGDQMYVLTRTAEPGQMYPGVKMYICGGAGMQTSGLSPSILPIRRLATLFTRSEIDQLHKLDPRGAAMGFEAEEA